MLLNSKKMKLVFVLSTLLASIVSTVAQEITGGIQCVYCDAAGGNDCSDPDDENLVALWDGDCEELDQIEEPEEGADEACFRLMRISWELENNSEEGIEIAPIAQAGAFSIRGSPIGETNGAKQTFKLDFSTSENYVDENTFPAQSTFTDTIIVNANICEAGLFARLHAYPLPKEEVDNVVIETGYINAICPVQANLRCHIIGQEKPIGCAKMTADDWKNSIRYVDGEPCVLLRYTLTAVNRSKKVIKTKIDSTSIRLAGVRIKPTSKLNIKGGQRARLSTKFCVDPNVTSTPPAAGQFFGRIKDTTASLIAFQQCKDKVKVKPQPVPGNSAPTKSPTKAPTKAPTMNSTKAPKPPTVNSTKAPKPPTVNSTKAPKPPTVNSTKAPTKAPTVNSTKAPKPPTVNSTKAPKPPTVNSSKAPKPPSVNSTKAPSSPSSKSSKEPSSPSSKSSKEPSSPSSKSSKEPSSPSSKSSKEPSSPSSKSSKEPSSPSSKSSKEPSSGKGLRLLR